MPDTSASLPLSQYAGVYADSLYGRVEVRAGAQPQATNALTLLWHKPPGEHPPPPEAHGLRCATPLDATASGLVVFTGHAAVWRALTQSEPPLEQEWLELAEKLEAG